MGHIFKEIGDKIWSFDFAIDWNVDSIMRLPDISLFPEETAQAGIGMYGQKRIIANSLGEP